LVALESSEVTEEPYPEIGITEETRRMYPETYSDKYNKVFMQFVDDIFRPNHVPAPKHTHDILLDELAIMYEANMTIGGEQNRFNASVIRAAINVIMTCTK
jgi:hypothetical protein